MKALITGVSLMMGTAITLTVMHSGDRQKRETENSTDVPLNVSFDRFMELHEIESYLDEVVLRYPEVASLEVIGTSYEGRPLRMLKLSSPSQNTSNKPGVFVDAGIHAAEWLGPSTALYAIQRLTSDYKTLLDIADWFVMPMINPDGYLYSWTHNRFWRKNLRPHLESNCTGVDLNRNFDIKWGGGNVSDPCAWNYPGEHANSEPETRAIADFLQAKEGKITLYMMLHTYGPFLLFPYGFSNDTPSQELIDAGNEAAEAVQKVRGTVYKAGSVPKLIHMAYGSSMDLAYVKHKVPLSYVWELPPGAEVKLAPPPEDILPSAVEVWEGFKVLVHRAVSLWHARNFTAVENQTIYPTLID